VLPLPVFLLGLVCIGCLRQTLARELLLAKALHEPGSGGFHNAAAVRPRT
jgi:hypothetical protein